jgi:hypothetical protein
MTILPYERRTDNAKSRTWKYWLKLNGTVSSDAFGPVSASERCGRKKNDLACERRRCLHHTDAGIKGFFELREPVEGWG